MDVQHLYVPMRRTFPSRHGLSEKELRRRLEKQGWIVWRGGRINIINEEVYPNVRRKYELLCSLLEKHQPGTLEELQYLCSVHHGMPDFICFRNGEFKFVECKLGHEGLSERQKTCISKLRGLGFMVEVHKLVDHCTKTRLATVNIAERRKQVIEKQMGLRGYIRVKRRRRKGI